jgi:hypothetical protein
MHHRFLCQLDRPTSLHAPPVHDLRAARQPPREPFQTPSELGSIGISLFFQFTVMHKGQFRRPPGTHLPAARPLQQAGEAAWLPVSLHPARWNRIGFVNFAKEYAGS